MTNAEIVKILIKHENPFEEASHNISLANKYTASSMRSYIYNITPKSAIGKLMLMMYNNPGSSKDVIRKTCGYKGQCAEYFSLMLNAGLIYNIRRRGYYVSELGVAILVMSHVIS